MAPRPPTLASPAPALCAGWESEVTESLILLEVAQPVRSEPHMELLLLQVGEPDLKLCVLDCFSVAESNTSVWGKSIYYIIRLR